MIKHVPIVSGLAGILAGVGLMTASAEPIPFEHFSKFPDVSSVSMSLEGDMMVAVVSDPNADGDQRAAAYWALPKDNKDIDTSKILFPTAVTPTSGKTKFFAASALKQKKSLWLTVQAYTGALLGCGEGKTTGSTKKYIQKAYMGNELIKKIDDLPSGRTEIGANKMMERCFELSGDTQLVSILPLDPTDVILARTDTDGTTRYNRHNLKTGKEKFLFVQDDRESFEISDETGEIFARERLEFEDGDWKYYTKLKDKKTGEFEIEEPLTYAIKDRFTMSVLGKKKDTDATYFVLTDKFTDKASIFEYDAEANKFADEAAFQHPEFNISGITISVRKEDFGKILAVNYQGDVSRRFWIDQEMAAIQAGLEKTYPGKNVTLNDWTNDRNRILFTVSGSDMAPAYFLLLDKSRVAVIGSSRPWLDNDSLGKTELIYYTARDGLKIPGLLTLPPGYKKGDKVRGAIVHPHGGPWARDYAGFDSSGWTGYFASRGYAILQPQYRGSDGWGRKLWMAGDGEWGQKMQDDKDDGAAWLVQQGYVDADKIAIHGYSYGGFAAIAASVRPNSPFACAIAGAGVANLTKLGNSWGSNRIQRIVQGHTVTGMDPMQNTDKINIPILLYHGDYDVRVPLWHSVDFYNKIKDRMPESKLIVLEQMGHQSNKWLPEHKETVLKEMEAFLHGPCGM